MSLVTLERAILASARSFFMNMRLRHADIREWSSGPIQPQEGEIVAWLANPGVHVAVLKTSDKRGAK